MLAFVVSDQNSKESHIDHLREYLWIEKRVSLMVNVWNLEEADRI
jgi:hypothetical protein